MFQGIKHIYFLGIGGIGMSALARYFHARGIRISGYDKTPSDLTSELIAEGMQIHFDDNVDSVPGDIDLVVITPAIPSDHREWNYLRTKNIPIKKRAEVLGMISRDSVCLAVAGTHGKTTTTTMLAHFLRSSGVNCTAFLGGVAANYMTNYLQGDPNLIVVEADEYDRSFLHLAPNGAILTAIDPDHLDIYGSHESVKESYRQFIGKIKSGGPLVLKAGIGKSIAGDSPVKVHEYGIEAGENQARKIEVKNGAFNFEYHGDAFFIRGLALTVPGRHNVENATAAITLALEFGATPDGIRRGVADFRGVHRRFEYALKTDRHIVIDDYAHHPEELKAAISAARELYPNRKITGVFQPHLYSRTRDFANEFARSLELLDTVILLDIYPARELPIEGVSSKILLDKIRSSSKHLTSKEELVNLLTGLDSEVILMMGAGDIDRLVAPVASAMKMKGGTVQ